MRVVHARIVGEVEMCSVYHVIGFDVQSHETVELASAEIEQILWDLRLRNPLIFRSNLELWLKENKNRGRVKPKGRTLQSHQILVFDKALRCADNYQKLPVLECQNH